MVGGNGGWSQEGPARLGELGAKRHQQKESQRTAQHAGQHQQRRRAGRAGPQGRGGQQLDVAAAEKASREQLRADEEDGQRATNSPESANEAPRTPQMQ